MKLVIFLCIIMTFGLLFSTSSGILKGEVFAYEEEQQQRNDYYYKDQYDIDSFYGKDKELLEEIGNKLFDGMDKDRLLNNALKLLSEYDIDIGALE